VLLRSSKVPIQILNINRAIMGLGQFENAHDKTFVRRVVYTNAPLRALQGGIQWYTYRPKYGESDDLER